MGFFLSFLYLLGFAFIVIYLRSLKAQWLKVLRVLVSLAVLIHGFEILRTLLTAEAFYPTNPLQSNLLVTFVMGLFALGLSLQRTHLSLALVLLPTLSVALVAFEFYSPASVTAPVPSPWLWSHILLMLMGESLFVLAAVISGLFVVVDQRLRKRQRLDLFGSIPSLERLDRVASDFILVGFFLLSFGIALGVFFAERYWESAWWLDPKVLFCFLTWALYGVWLMVRWIRPQFRGRKAAWFSLIALSAVLFVAWGVEHLFPSQHINYGSVEERE